MEVPIPSFKEEIICVSKIMEEAGKIILKNYENPNGVKRKDDGTFVTDVDKNVSELIYNSLKEKFPDYGFIDEEQELKNEKRRKVWLSDPLDGTLEYVEKTGDFGVIIGLLENNEPVFGATYKPMRGELVYAAKGYGAYLSYGGDIKRINVSPSTDISVLVSRSRKNQELERMVESLNAVSITRMGSSLKTVEVAKGNASLFLCPKKSHMSPWDILPPGLILEEAGGKITNLYGNKITMESFIDNNNLDGIVATNEVVHDKVLQSIAPFI